MLSDQYFLQEAIYLGNLAHTELQKWSESPTTQMENNLQMILQRYKDCITKMVWQRLKKKTPKLCLVQSVLEVQLKAVQHSTSNSPECQSLQEADRLREWIADIDKKMAALTALLNATMYTMNAERVSKFWFALNKPKAPRDLFFALQQEGTGEPQYETRSDRMAELAQNYHESLQSDRMEEPGGALSRQHDIKQALKEVNTTLPADQVMALTWSVSCAEVQEALKVVAAGKATGLDGLPYEFWSTLDVRWSA